MHPELEKYLTELAKDATPEDLAAFREFAQAAYDLGKNSLRAELDALRHDQENLDHAAFLDATAQQVLPEALRLARAPGVNRLGLSVEAFAAFLDATARALLAERTRRQT